jgi:hypothetical protein
LKHCGYKNEKLRKFLAIWRTMNKEEEEENVA